MPTPGIEDLKLAVKDPERLEAVRNTRKLELSAAKTRLEAVGEPELASCAKTGEARGDSAFHSAVFAPIYDPFGAAGETAIRIAAPLEAEIITVGAGGALGEPVVIGRDGGGDVCLIDFDTIFWCQISSDVPGLHFHTQ